MDFEIRDDTQDFKNLDQVQGRCLTRPRPKQMLVWRNATRNFTDGSVGRIRTYFRGVADLFKGLVYSVYWVCVV